VFVPELLEAVAERLSLELFEPKQIGESGEGRATVAASELWQDEGGGGMRTVPLRFPGGVTLLRYRAEREHRQEVEISEAGIRIEVYPHTTEAQRVETIRMRVKAALESRVKYWRHRRRQDAAAKDGEIERQVAPGTEAGDIFQRSFLQEVGKRFPKVLVHLLVVRKECVYRKSEVYMDIDEAQVFLGHHGFIDGPAMDSYFGYLRSDKVKNHHLAHRHQLARKGALALLRNRGDWRKGARLVNRRLHGTQPG
jgi:hypothetical protein